MVRTRVCVQEMAPAHVKIKCKEKYGACLLPSYHRMLLLYIRIYNILGKNRKKCRKGEKPARQVNQTPLPLSSRTGSTTGYAVIY